MSARLHVAPTPPEAEVPADDFADRVRDRISDRAQGMEQACPEANDLAAAVVVALHARLHGRAAALRGGRPANYFRRQIRGEEPISVEDLAHLAIEAPSAAVPALAILLRRAGYRIEPMDPLATSVPEAAAMFIQGSAAVAAEATRALADGHVDEAEAETIERELEVADRRAAVLRSALAQSRRRP